MIHEMNEKLYEVFNDFKISFTLCEIIGESCSKEF